MNKQLKYEGDVNCPLCRNLYHLKTCDPELLKTEKVPACFSCFMSNRAVAKETLPK